jgi:hypothetical protein
MIEMAFAPVLYRNTSIKSLDLRNIDLDDIEFTNVLRELIRRNRRLVLLTMPLEAMPLLGASRMVCVVI